MIGKEIDNANKHLENASVCIDKNMYGLAVVSIYTSMFHAARAILFRDGIKERSHICIIIYLKERYPTLEDYVKVLDSYRRTRHTALYGIDSDINKDDATYGIDLAKKFIKAVKDEI